MQRILFVLSSIILFGVSVYAQPVLLHNDKVTFRSGPTSINPDWAPFYHGVASGDPMEDRVIIWTRVTPEEMNNEPVDVNWFVAADIEMNTIIQSGTFTTGAERDYTVKVDVTGLESGTTYYYVFSVENQFSLIGKTKTTPTADQSDHLRFGIVSCSNFQAGYFNTYKRISERNDLDAVIHLGDYIYEYADGVYGDEELFDNRPLEPATEIVTLEDYRTRYSTYRLDTALARVHQQHPFIVVWDDHESANDAYVEGAENHDDETQGNWEDRKAASKQAYFEWLPIRENQDQSVYRKIRYGNLMDLIMLDTRLEGREEQILDVTAPALYDTNRTLLGAEQKAWFLEQLSTSEAKWKVVGQQVIFSELNVGWAALLDESATFEGFESLFLDIWDGYPAERAQIIEFIEQNEINNTVILTGDFHSTFAFDVTAQPVDLTFPDIPGVGVVPNYGESPGYDAGTGAGSVAVEFAVPSATSANFDENTDALTALVFQNQINNPLEPQPGFSLGNPNPHMKYTDLIQHGYYVLDITENQAQADYFYTDISVIADVEAYGEGWFTADGENHLQESAAPSAEKEEQDTPAPNDPPASINRTDEVAGKRSFAVLGVYPNPFNDTNTLHYSLSESAKVNIELLDSRGKIIRSLLDKELKAGIFSLQLNGNDLPSGIYFYRMVVNDQVQHAKLIRK
jgi:alkaline phosphatase D